MNSYSSSIHAYLSESNSTDDDPFTTDPKTEQV